MAAECSECGMWAGRKCHNETADCGVSVLEGVQRAWLGAASGRFPLKWLTPPSVDCGCLLVNYGRYIIRIRCVLRWLLRVPSDTRASEAWSGERMRSLEREMTTWVVVATTRDTCTQETVAVMRHHSVLRAGDAPSYYFYLVFFIQFHVCVIGPQTTAVSCCIVVWRCSCDVVLGP